MRKHNEGYALVLVLVTMVVLSLVSVALMSVGLRNLKSQQAVGERMVDKYAAQGQIEIILAKLTQTVEKEITQNAQLPENGDSGEMTEEESQDLKDRLNTYVSDWVKEQTGITVADVTLPETVKPSEQNAYSCTLTLKATEGAVQIECQLILSGKVTENNDAHGKTTYKIEPEEPAYRSYVISRAEQGGDGQ